MVCFFPRNWVNWLSCAENWQTCPAAKLLSRCSTCWKRQVQMRSWWRRCSSRDETLTTRPASRPSCSLNLSRSHAFRFFQSQGFDSILAQDELLHLATARQGIGLDELEVARNLLVADLAFAVLAPRLLGYPL